MHWVKKRNFAIRRCDIELYNLQLAGIVMYQWCSKVYIGLLVTWREISVLHQMQLNIFSIIT